MRGATGKLPVDKLSLIAYNPPITPGRFNTMATFSHVIHDDSTIHGAGASEDAAWDDYNDTMTKAGIDPDSMTEVKCSRCSAGVSCAVEQGSPASWIELGGVVMLRSER